MFIAIDLGGTKTEIVVEDERRTLFEATVATRDWQRGELLSDRDNAARMLALFGHVLGASEAALVVGAHGLDSQKQVDEFTDWLRAVHNGPVLAVNDVELLAPAAGYDHAIAVIVGTGSKVVGHDADGSIVSAGGYGFLLSDPGSAAGLARDSMRAILDRFDEGLPADALGRLFLQHFDLTEIVDLSYAFTTRAEMNAWASLAPLVFDAADEGSDIAERVITSAAAELAEDVGLVHAHGALGNHVVCAGGVITHQPRLYRALARHIDDLGLGLTVELLTVPPIRGAVALARKLSESDSASSISWRIS